MKDYLERDLVGGAVTQPAEVVFVIWGGANDYISKEPFTGDISTLLDDPDSQAGYRRIVLEAVASLADQVRVLYAAGGRQFVVLNLPDLGKTPIVMQNQSYFPSGRKLPDPHRRLQLSAKLSQLTAYHNSRLTRELTALRRELPDAKIVYVDSARLVAQILDGRAPDGSRERFDYGFSVRELSSELRDGRTRGSFQNRCYSGGYLGTLDAASAICAQSQSAMFWDVVHPTSYTHCWLAYFVQGELASAGLAPKPGSTAEQRAYCTARNYSAF